MIWSFEDIDDENLAVKKWQAEEYEIDINHIIEMLITLPLPCDEPKQCQSNYISDDKCECMRGIFTNEFHQEIYKLYLRLFLETLITDTLLIARSEKETTN